MREVVLDIAIVLGFLRKTEPIRYVCMNIYTFIYIHGYINTEREKEIKELAHVFVEAGKSKFSEQAKRPETQRNGCCCSSSSKAIYW